MRRGRIGCDPRGYTGGMSETLLLGLLLAAVVVAIAMLAMLLWRKPPRPDLAAEHARLEQALREDQRAGRGELREELAALSGRTEHRLELLRQTLSEDSRKARSDAAELQARFVESLGQRLKELGDRNEQRLGEMRGTLEQKLRELQEDN